MARRPDPPDILGEVLGTPDQVIRSGLRYDYSLIDAEQRSQVQNAAVAIVRSGRKAQDGMIEMGQRLLEVKALLPHGQFSDWCDTEFNMSQRTVQRMMAVADAFRDDEKRHSVSLFSDSALYLLAAPSTPEAAREEVIAEAQTSGSSPTKARVQEIINQHKPPTPTYATVWEIESKVKSVVNAKWPEGKSSLTWISAMRTAGHTSGSAFMHAVEEALDAADIEFRKRDLIQAINNVASQLEQELRRKENETPSASSPATPVTAARSIDIPIKPPSVRDAAATATSSDDDGGEKPQDLTWDLAPWQRDAGWTLTRIGRTYRAEHPRLGAYESTDPTDVSREINVRMRSAAQQPGATVIDGEVDHLATTDDGSGGKPLVDWTPDDWNNYSADTAAPRLQPAEEAPAPVRTISDNQLLAVAQEAVSAADLAKNKIRKPFLYDGALWTAVGAVYAPLPQDCRVSCVRLHPAGEAIAPGVRAAGYVTSSYRAGTPVSFGSTHYVLGEQWMVVHGEFARPSAPAEALTAASGGVVDTATADDTNRLADAEDAAIEAAQIKISDAISYLHDARRELEPWQHDELCNFLDEMIARLRKAVKELD